MTAVLVVGFNRPELLRRVLERVEQSDCARLYVALDGPRHGNERDRALVDECRSVVSAVRDLDVRTRFLSENAGCGRAVSGAISWFFEHEEQGIILEDDILADSTFFPFCAELLERHARDEDVFAVSGCNFVPRDELGEWSSYRFSRVPHIWGWATWRRAWRHYTFDAPRGNQRLSTVALWQAVSGNPIAFAYWRAFFEMTRRGRIDTWDYQLVYACMRLGGRVATANSMLVENLGFGGDATHTLTAPPYVQASEPMGFPLVSPTLVFDQQADRWVQREVFGASPSGVFGAASNIAGRQWARFRPGVRGSLTSHGE